MNVNQNQHTKETEDRLRAVLASPPKSKNRLDGRVRVLLSFGFGPEWVAAYFYEISLRDCRAYFKGRKPIKPEHDEPLTSAAWRVVQTAQSVLIDESLKNPVLLGSQAAVDFSSLIQRGYATLREDGYAY